MVTTTPQNQNLPHLSDRESHLLAAFIRLNFSIFKLAEEEHLLPRELLAFTESAAIQSHLDQLKTFSESALSLRAIASKNQALDHLQKVATTTENLIEKRRAASAMLRILCAKTAAAGNPWTAVHGFDDVPSTRDRAETLMGATGVQATKHPAPTTTNVPGLNTSANRARQLRTPDSVSERPPSPLTFSPAHLFTSSPSPHLPIPLSPHLAISPALRSTSRPSSLLAAAGSTNTPPRTC